MKNFSIITVCKNAENEIEITLKSILAQNYNLSIIEVIIIDGLSTDNTTKIVKQYGNHAKQKNLKIKLYSEKDNGIYDAMNKGAQHSTAEWCIYLNAGDAFFCNNALNKLASGCSEKYDIVYGDAIHSYKNKYKKTKSRSETEIDFLHGMEFCHQACAIRTEYLQTHLYTLTFEIAGDCDFFTKAYVEKARFHYIPEIISIFDKNGISSNNGGLVKKENAKIKYKYGLSDVKRYQKELFSAEIQIIIRKFLPKHFIQYRHNKIMKKATKNWKTLKEIVESEL